jgi:hypothetical protein
MKKIARPFLFFTILMLCYGCRNNGDANRQNEKPLPTATDKAAKVSGYQTEETIDTADCAALIEMTVIDKNSWSIHCKHTPIIKNDRKPDLKIFMQKQSVNQNVVDNLIIGLRIDSALCIDHGALVRLLFKDSSVIELKSFEANNCEGIVSTCFDERINKVTKSKAAIDINKVRTDKIVAIEIETHSGKLDYHLSDVKATNLRHLIDCINTTK